jgi:hypothetical protein
LKKKIVVGATKYNRKLDNTNGRTFYIAAAADLLLKKKAYVYTWRCWGGEQWTVGGNHSKEKRRRRK